MGPVEAVMGGVETIAHTHLISPDPIGHFSELGPGWFLAGGALAECREVRF